jgi:hypothetical protein
MYDAGTMAIDTLALAQRLRARGIAQDQADEIVAVVRDSQRNLVTTERFNSGMAEMKATIDAGIEKLAVQQKMTLWVIALLGIGSIAARIFNF